METDRGWAIVQDEKMKVHAAELPIYWLRATAKREGVRIFPSGRFNVIRVEIREVKRKAKKHFRKEPAQQGRC